MSDKPARPSSLASLPPPSSVSGRSASAGAPAAAGAASPGAADRRDSKSSGNVSATSAATGADAALESRIAAIVEKRLAALAAVKSLAKTPSRALKVEARWIYESKYMTHDTGTPPGQTAHSKTQQKRDGYEIERGGWVGVERLGLGGGTVTPEVLALLEALNL